MVDLEHRPDAVQVLPRDPVASCLASESRSIDLHLHKLEGEGFVRRMGGEGAEAQWRLTVSPAASPVPSL